MPWLLSFHLLQLLTIYGKYLKVNHGRSANVLILITQYMPTICRRSQTDIGWNGCFVRPLLSRRG